MRKLISLFVTGLMALTMIAGVAAQDTNDALVCVAPLTGDDAGSINVAIAEADFGTVPYNPTAAETSESDVVVTVTDDRGVVGGWDVTISGTSFVTSPSTLTFPSTALDLSDSATATSPATGSFATEGGPVPTTPDTNFTIITATNVGTSPTSGYVFNFEESELTVPAGTLVGEYKSTLTVTLTAGEFENPCVEVEGNGPGNGIGVVRNW